MRASSGSAEQFQRLLQHIERLDFEEKAVLREFSLYGNTVELPTDNPAVAGLVQKGIIQYVGTQGHLSIWGRMFPMQLTDTADKLLKNEHMDLSKAEGELSAEQIDWMRANRPAYTRQGR